MTAEGAEGTADVAEAVARFGRPAVRIVPLNPLIGEARQRASFRVETGGGTAVKVRRMESEGAASRQAALRAGLPEPFAPVLARIGAILIEAWVDGTPLGVRPPDEGRLRDAAGILAALHAVPAAGGTSLPFSHGLDGLCAETLSGLRELAAAGAVGVDVAGRLAERVDRLAPGAVRHCLIHTDFCGENLVVDSGGRLFVVDNEHFRFGPPGMDLARTWYRWGWHDGGARGWAGFSRAYAEAGGDAEAFEHAAFWRIAAVVISARLRLRIGHPDAPVAVDCLTRLASAED